MARLAGNDWLDHLPWVLLGIRTAVKEAMGTSVAKMVCGTPLTVPADFFPANQPDPGVLGHLEQLREITGSLAPARTVRHSFPPSNLPKSLNSCGFVFVKRGQVRPSLRAPYDGPFEVLEKGDKTFKIRIGTKSEVVSLDRLKPASLDPTNLIEVTQPPRRGRTPGQRSKSHSQNGSASSSPIIPSSTRCGRPIIPPNRLVL